MIQDSTNVGHNYTVPTTLVAGKVLTYTIKLKSNAVSDDNDIRSFQFRALERNTSDRVLSSGGSHTLGSNTMRLVPKKRPQLMHQSGAFFTTDTNGVKFCEVSGSEAARDIRSVNLLLRPVTGNVKVARGAIGVTITPAGVMTADAGVTVYLNGAVWTGTQPFPFPRLITLVYTATATGPLTVGSDTGTSSFYLQRVAVSTRNMSASDVADHAQMFYRKPSAIVLTDSAVSVAPSDAPVSIPEVWVAV